jgi:uncharacterized protein (DUF58 family)
MTLAPGQNTTLTASFEPQKRGVLSLSGLAVQSYFPFFLSRHSQRLEDTAEVYVLPPGLKGAVPSLRHIAEQASKRMAQGSDNAGRGGRRWNMLIHGNIRPGIHSGASTIAPAAGAVSP